MLKWFSRISVAVGSGVVAVSVVLYGVFDHYASTEQALSPGQDSLGVAVVGMMYGPPIIAIAAVGLLILLFGMSLATIHRFRNPI